MKRTFLPVIISALLIAALPVYGVCGPVEANDDYVVRAVMPSGASMDIIVPALTKFKVSVQSSVSWDSYAHEFVYEYRLANSDGSAQRIGRLEITLNPSIGVTASPGWKAGDARLGTARWENDGAGGVGPGDTALFTIRSRYFPGVTSARLRGVGQGPNVPEWVSQGVREQVDAIVKGDVVVVSVVAPMIPYEPTEPNDLGSLVDSVRGYFFDLLINYSHPRTSAINEALTEASEAAHQSDNARSYSALQRAVVLASSSIGSVPMQNVATALRITVDAVSMHLN